jgi:two-component system, cell cycle response regulator CpdR
MPRTHADYLRRKAQRCCELAADCKPGVSKKLLALALDMEVMAAAVELEQGRSAEPKSGDGPRQLTVLFVDDDSSVRDVVIHMLADQGFAVLSAPDANAALQILAGRAVDLLFTDITMPDIDGVELARHARILDSEIKVLFVTGYPTRAAERDATNYGKLLFKPLRREELLREVQVALSA